MERILLGAAMCLLLMLSVGYLAEKKTGIPVAAAAEVTEEVSAETAETVEAAELPLLVNRAHPLSKEYAPEIVAVAGQRVEGEKTAVEALEKMLADGETEGLRFVVCSGYRTEDEQRRLYLNQIQKKMAEGLPEAEACREAERYSAVPGHSEHQTGLAFDIVAVQYQMLNDGYADTPEARWLFAHAAEYGFILRYPKGGEETTGIAYEPWHYRYVGEAAEEITRQGITLEEYCAGN